jgi:hypothetical protein
MSLTKDARMEPPIQLLNRLSAELAAAMIFKRMLCNRTLPFIFLYTTNYNNTRVPDQSVHYNKKINFIQKRKLVPG